MEEVMADEVKPITALHVTVELVVNCACEYGPSKVQLAFTLQSYTEPAVSPLRLTDRALVAVAVLIHGPGDEESL